MGPVEPAIRARFNAPVTLRTLGQGKPFVLDSVGHDGIVLLLGSQRNYTPLGWQCLEGIVPFLRRYPSWIPAGGTYTTDGDRGTLDEHLKGCVSRQTSRWVTVVLLEAGVIRVDNGRPLQIRLSEIYR